MHKGQLKRGVPRRRETSDHAPVRGGLEARLDDIIERAAKAAAERARQILREPTPAKPKRTHTT